MKGIPWTAGNEDGKKEEVVAYIGWGFLLWEGERVKRGFRI